jgi:uncharacterized protein YfeS
MMKSILVKILSDAAMLSVMVAGVYINSQYDIIGEVSSHLRPAATKDLHRGDFTLRKNTIIYFG